MLQSKFAKKTSDFKAQKIFTDRQEPRAVFKESIEKLFDKPREIINYYGKGGVGKTTLLHNLKDNSFTVYSAHKKLMISNIFVSLDAFEYSNPVNILTGIRNGISGDCGLFDYAVTQYYAKARMTIDEIRNKNKLLSPAVTAMLGEAVTLASGSVCIPTAILGKAISFIKDIGFKAKYKAEIAEISMLSEFEIFERLPYYLGLCINNAFEKNRYHVIFLDSYESLLNRTAAGTPSVDHEDWLKELFLSCENIRLVIASRDRMNWDRRDPDWGEFLNAHRLNDLSDEDSSWFLEQVPIPEEEIRDAIVSASAGAPLFLDMCVDMYAKAKNDGESFDLDILNANEPIIDRYIRHLAPRDGYAVKVLSVPRQFEIPFAKILLRRQNLDYTSDELSELLEKSIFLPITDDGSVYKVDESMRAHLMRRMSDERKSEVLGDILDCIRSEKGAVKYTYFASALDTLLQNPECFKKLYSEIFELVDFYSNAGYWRELRHLLGKQTESDDPAFKALAVTHELIYLRRAGELKSSLAFIDSHPVDREAMGEWYYLYKYLCIQTRHLLGYYDESIEAYRELISEMDLVRHNVPAHVYNIVVLKYADLNMLKGRFDESLKMTEALLSGKDLPIEDKLELIRLKGHNYRFMKKYREAETVYGSAVKLIDEYGMINSRGKMYTNMVETLCAVRPLDALGWYEKAIEDDLKTDNRIELGKAYAAGATAFGMAGDPEKGIEIAFLALETAEKSGYNSGRAFAFAAQAFVYKKAGQKEKSREAYKNLKELLEKLNVYKYLLDLFTEEYE